MKLSSYYIKALDISLLLLFCCFIFWLSDQSTLPTPLKFPHQDKVMHLGAYFILTFFVVRAFRHFLQSYRGLLISSLMFSSFYGASDEYHQSFVTGRMSDVNDWFADTLGAILFLAMLTLVRRYKNKN
jgi:VanZ family protein